MATFIGQAIVHYTLPNPNKSANAAFLMGCYGVLHLGLSPKDAIKPLTMNGSVIYRPFQDATEGESSFTITILDCLKAIKKARDLGFFNFKDFDFDDYNRLDKIAGGDLNWIVPGKFLAFTGPVDLDFCVNLYHPPDIYISYFLENNVKVVIRLNKKLYDDDVFRRAGIIHHDLFFPDGSCPPRHVLFKFLQICENTDGAIAVHCKAGLGRTGSLIGSYLMKHYQMSAREAIGWMRICRPGSVIGHQQEWLEQLEKYMAHQGDQYRKKNRKNHIPEHAYGIYSIAEKVWRKKHGSKVLARGSHSPPPPIFWNSRSNILPSPRPRASKLREAVKKPLNESNSSADSSKERLQRTFYKRDQTARSRDTTRRGGDAGERSLHTAVLDNKKISSSRASSNSQNNGSLSFQKDMTYTSRCSRNVMAARPINPAPSPVRTTAADNKYTSRCSRNVMAARPINPAPSPVRTTAADNKNTFVKGKEESNTASRYERLNHLCHILSATPHNAHKVTPKTNNNKTSEMYSTAASRGSAPVQPQTRRRLGRSPSPSPPPSRQPRAERTRATNTPNRNSPSGNGSRRSLTRNASKTSLKKALSRLKCVPVVANAGSIGGHSFGAGSLGARRSAPAPVVQRSPRVRSDERTIATQGDVLNSIKNDVPKADERQERQ